MANQPNDPAADDTDSPVIDPLAEARWEQVRGDEEGIRTGGTTETDPVPKPPVAGGSPAPNAETDPAVGGLTGGMGDPGGER